MTLSLMYLPLTKKISKFLFDLLIDGSPRYPSRFVLEPAEGLIEYVEKPREDLIKETKEYIGISDRVMKGQDEVTRLPVGSRVKHAIFGEGEIIGVDTDRNAYIVKFDGQHTERLISFRVNLEVTDA